MNLILAKTFYKVKARLAFAMIALATSSSCRFLISAIFFTTSLTYTGSLRRPRYGTGATYGASVSDIIIFVSESDNYGKRKRKTKIQKSFSLFWGAGKEVNIAFNFGVSLEYFKSILISLPDVEHQWFIEFIR